MAMLTWFVPVGFQSTSLMVSDHETLSFSSWHLLSIYNLDFNALCSYFQSAGAIKYTTPGVMAMLTAYSCRIPIHQPRGLRSQKPLSFSSWHLLSIYNLDFNELCSSLQNAEAIHDTTPGVMAVLTWLWYGYPHRYAVNILTVIYFVVIKIILGVNLITYVTRRRAGMEGREAVDVVTDFDKDPIGEGADERKYNKNLKTCLNDSLDDAPRLSDTGENKPGQCLGKKERLELEDLRRYRMVKRMW